MAIILNQKQCKKFGRAGLLLVLGLAMFSWLALPMSAAAHPLGNFTVNHYTRLDVGAAGIQLYYIIDMAEIPTYQEKDLIDTNHDGQINETEKRAYLNNKVLDIENNFRLTVGGAPIALKVGQSDLAFLPGQGGLETMRLTVTYQSDPLTGNANTLAYQDSNYNDRLGWREIVIRNATGVALTQSSAPDQTQSDELRSYPQDMLTSPLNMTTAQASFRLDPTVVVNRASTAGSQSVIDRAQDPFADLVKGGELTLGVVLISLVLAFVLGMAHAFSPGHGKTVMGAYLVGTRGTLRHAFFLGGTITVTHTLGVFALGLITLLASQFILPEKLYPWLGLFSGLIVLVMGLTLVRSRLHRAVIGDVSDAHAHTHGQDGPQGYYEYDFSQEDNVAIPARFEQTGDGLTHSHGGVTHSHLPPGVDGGPVTWKRLLLFGISAGLLPCPSALVVMLSSIALGRTVFGLVLIVFFSLGLACTLTGIGMALVYARKLSGRIKLNFGSGPSKLAVRFLPVLSAAIVAIIGIAITFDAIMQTGILNR